MVILLVAFDIKAELCHYRTLCGFLFVPQSAIFAKFDVCDVNGFDLNRVIRMEIVFVEVLALT